jgi:hypothetical protein
MFIPAVSVRKITTPFWQVPVESTKLRCSTGKMMAKSSSRGSDYMVLRTVFFQWTTAGPETNSVSQQLIKAFTFMSTKRNDSGLFLKLLS